MDVEFIEEGFRFALKLGGGPCGEHDHQNFFHPLTGAGEGFAVVGKAFVQADGQRLTVGGQIAELCRVSAVQLYSLDSTDR